MKKGYMILSGGGDLKQSFQIDEKFFSLLGNNSKILYVPVALKRDRIGYESCYDWFSTIVSSHSGKKDIDYTMLLDEGPIPDLVSYDSIYMGGGNTYKLLDYLVKSGLGKKIKVYIESGGIVYGGSAGAMVLGKDIRTAESENDNNYLYYKGLNLLDGNSISCHYVENSDEEIFSVVKKIKSTVIALPEESGIVLSGNGKIVDTVGSVFVFNKDNKSKL